MEESRLASYRPAAKMSVVAYALALLVGCFGAHRFYLDRPLTGLAMAVISLSPMALLVLPPAYWQQTYEYGVLAVMGVWNAVDMFLIPGWVRECNGEGVFDAPIGAVPPPLPRRSL